MGSCVLHRKTKGEKVRFSPKYKSFEDWLSSFKGSEEYKSRVIRLHSKYPNASLSQLRGHAPKDKKLVSELKPRPVYERSWSEITKRELRIREKSLEVLRKVRNGKFLTEASKELHTTPETVIKNTGAFRKVKGKWIAKSQDRISGKEIRNINERLKSQFASYDVQDIENVLSNARPEDLISLIGDLNEGQHIDLKPILSLIINSIFSDKQRDEMIHIISTSPMAMDYFLNLRSADRIYLFVTILRFYLGSLFVDSEKASLVNSVNQDKSAFERNPMSFITGILNFKNVLNDNPLLTILRSYFIVDSFNGNVAENEYSNSVLKEILLPKVIQ